MIDYKNIPSFFAGKWGLNKEEINKILKTALGRGGDFADLYLEYRIDESYILEDGLLKDVSENISGGAGVRVIKGDKTGLADSDFNIESILSAAKTASYIAEGKQKKVSDFETWRSKKSLYFTNTALSLENIDKKLSLLRKGYDAAKKVSNKIKKVSVRLSVTDKYILIANSEGLFRWDYQPSLRFIVGSIAIKGSRREDGRAIGCTRGGMEFFLENTPEYFGEKSAKEALTALEALDAPAGVMEVVLAPGETGVLFHEAIGHGFEADGIRKKTAVFHDMLGKRVGTSKVNVIDDGTIPNEWGSINIDDEGTPAERTVLIEKGVVKGFISDRLNAKLLKKSMTGNGRRQSYAHQPIPRMRNTFMPAGDEDPKDIIKSVNRGLYAVDFAGGQVDPTSGKFVFSLRNAYMIESGKISYPVKGATLVGNCADILKKVEMVGYDFRFSEGGGTCGKDGQWVPVNDGTPTLKLSEMTVGGTKI